MNEQAFRVEEVETAPEVAKAPPVGATLVDAPDGAGRQPDYLEGFLTAKPEPSTDGPGSELYESVIEALRSIFDPEIPVNIYDLGLIYGVDIDGGHAVVTMTLTTPHCPVAETMPGEVEMRVMSVPGIATAEVNLVWDPAWDPGQDVGRGQA